MLAWLAPLIVFGLVVFVHELGHFLAAKLCGVYAPVFAFGWGPRLAGFKWGETDYRLSWFPVGGYVAMATRESEAMAAIEGNTDLQGNAPDGEDAASAGERPGHQRGFNPIPTDPGALRPFGPRPVPESRWIESKSLPAKIFIMSAGVMMNVVLALVVSVGVVARYGQPYVPAVVDSVVAGRPAMAAGLQRGDSIVSVGGVAVRTWADLVQKVTTSPGTPLDFEVVRQGGRRTTLRIVPELSADTDVITQAPIKVGRIGAAPQNRLLRERMPLGRAIADGWDVTWRMGGSVLKVVGGLFSGQVSVNQLGGPIAIARTSFEAAKNGWEQLLQLLAFLSINVAVLNMLPIPLLDGGQILMKVLERIKGSEFSVRTQELVMRAGVLAIALLFALVMFNDLKGLVTLFG